MPIPSSGDFRILVGYVAAITGEFQQGANAGNFPANILPAMSNVDMVAYLNANIGTAVTALKVRRSDDTFCGPPTEDPAVSSLHPVAGTLEISFWPATDEFIFNPGGGQEIVDILTSEFPLGFLATALQIVWFGTAEDDPFYGGIPQLRMKYNGQAIRTINNPALNNVTTTTTPTAIIPLDAYQGLVSVLGNFGLAVDMIDSAVASNGCGVFNVVSCDVIIRQFYVQGDYILWSSGLGFSPTEVARRDLTSQVFTLTDSENKLMQISNLFVTYVDEEIQANIPITIISQTAGIITFTLPDGIPAVTRLIIVADGTEFDGTTNVGVINVIRVDGSGLYKLVDGQTHDKVYNRDGDPVVIDDVKIPDPFGRTGFF